MRERDDKNQVIEMEKSTERKPDRQGWHKIIRPRERLLRLDIRELWAYRYMVMILIRRDFVTQYKQTILGPAWAIIRPLLTTLVFTIFFGNLAKLTTADAVITDDTVLPGFVFYMLGTVIWDYFSSVVNETSMTFQSNFQIMGKVYFPRQIMPVTIALSKLTSFVIQFALFVVIYLVCVFRGTAVVHVSWTIILFPLLLFQTMMLGMCFGAIISSLTVKYRDLSMLLGFFMQVWRYGSPFAYGLMLIPASWLSIYMLNPFTPIITTIRYIMFGTGYFNWAFYLLSWAVIIALAVVSLAVFNKTERNFIDTV